jgi:hypothetical protein
LSWGSIITIRKLTRIITYTKPGKDIRYLRKDDIKEDMDLAVSLEDSLKHALLKKGAKTLGRGTIDPVSSLISISTV